MSELAIGAPQLVMICLLAMSLGVNIASHGKPRTPVNAMTSLISLCFTLPLLWWGGFFTN